MKTSFFILALLVGLALSSCTNYVPVEYGPVEFETTLEGPLFGEMVVDGLVEFDFQPEEYNINRAEISSMVMKEIKLTTTYENGFGDFDNILFSFIPDGAQSQKVGTISIEGSPKEIIIPGLKESEIAEFKDVKKFHLEITAVTKRGIEDIYDDIPIKGSFTMDIMIPEKD